MKPEMWQKVAKFKGAEYFRKALYIHVFAHLFHTKKRYSGMVKALITEIVPVDMQTLSMAYLSCEVIC